MKTQPLPKIKLGMEKTFSDKVLSEHLKMEERSKKHAKLNEKASNVAVTVNKYLMTNGSDSVSNSMGSSPPNSSESAPSQGTPQMQNSPGRRRTENVLGTAKQNSDEEKSLFLELSESQLKEPERQHSPDSHFKRGPTIKISAQSLNNLSVIELAKASNNGSLFIENQGVID
jgi:hypothetical protein